MTERRTYDDDEVREIFDRAARPATAGRPAASDGGGLTLSQLQQVAAEVGLDPDRVAQAATAVEARRGLLPRETLLGVPTAVGRVIELPGAVPDRDWDRLVAELRETFGERGRVTSHGGERRWTAGDVRAALEPVGSGARLRVEARKEGAGRVAAAGATSGSVGAGLLTADVVADLLGGSIFTGAILTGPGLFIPLAFLALCVATLAPNLVGLPRWAREREGQMEALASRLERGSDVA